MRSGPAAGFHVVLGQPEQQRGRSLANREDDALRECLAADLDGSFEDLVRAYQDRLFSFALRMTARREDAEEAAQDAFVRAYRALSGYPPERIRQLALRAWLYQITLNVVRNRYRGKRLRLVSLDHPLTPRGETAWEAPDSEDGRPDAVYERSRRRADMETLVARLPERYRAPILLRYVEGLRLEEVARPDAVYERRRRRADMETLVARLPQRYRAPILLRYVEGLRLEEVARVLGQPLGTAKSNVHRGVNALREALVASRREGVRK